MGGIDLVQQNPANGGRYSVAHLIYALCHQIPGPSLRVADFEMEMGPARRAGVAEKSDSLALLDGELIALGVEIDPKRTFGILPGPHPAGDLRRKAIQVTVHGGFAVGMRHIEHIAVAGGRHPDARDVAVGNGIDRTTDPLQGLDVHPGVEMVGTDLADVAGQRDGKTNG